MIPTLERYKQWFEKSRDSPPVSAIKLLNNVFLLLIVSTVAIYSDLSVLSRYQQATQQYDQYFIVVTFLIGVLVLYGNKAPTGINKRTGQKGSMIENSSLKKLYTNKYALDIALLTVALSLFVSARYAYLGYSFGSVPHSDKYATHIPTVQNMYSSGDPFLVQNPAYVDLFQANSPNFFSGFPFYEWGILPFMALTEYVALEVAVRSFLTLCGLVLLVLIYILLRNMFSRGVAFAGLTILAINPMIQLISYITVMDLPSLIFMFGSLVSYAYGNRDLSYLLLGLSVYMKLSFLLIAAPVVGFLVITTEKNRLYELMKLGFFTALPTFLHELLIKPLPLYSDSSVIASGLLVMFLLTLTGGYLLVERKGYLIETQIERIDYRYRYSAIPVIPVVALFLLWDNIMAYQGQFLTNSQLLFNTEMYLQILQMVKGYVPNSLYYLTPLGFFIALNDKKHRNLVVGIFLSAVAYVVIASQSVYVHAYYKHIFVLLIILLSVYIIQLIYKVSDSKKSAIVISIVLLLLVAPSFAATNQMLDQEYAGTAEAGEYLDTNVGQSENIIVTQASPRIPATIYSKTNSPFVTGSDEDLKALIEQKGFKQALIDLNVVYYVSAGEGNFGAFEPLFRDDTSSSNDRTAYINRQTGAETPDRAGESVQPSQYFELETKIGEWHIYKLKE